MRKTIIVLGLYFLLTGYSQSQTHTEQIRLNQIGFYPQGPKKTAIINCNSSDSFFVLTKDLSDTVYLGEMSSPEFWSYSNENVRIADFSDLQEEGEFVVFVPGMGYSYDFGIKSYIHQNVGMAALKGFYFQRASTMILPPHSGKWWRSLGHPDNEVEIHPSAASIGRPAGTLISAPKGWYDAGDYNKYIVNSGISVYTLLSLFEHFPDYAAALEIDIPENVNNLPDLLDEILWNLDWMLTMQDPKDGGVYHKLTHAQFSGIVMPNNARAARYIVQKSTPAALDFAAVMAQASRIFSGFSDYRPGLSDSCLQAALQAWRWAKQNPAVYYNQDAMNQQFSPQIHTGEYGDSNVSDEFQWAAMELFVTTKQDSFLTDFQISSSAMNLPWWQKVNMLGYFSLLHHRSELNGIDTTALKQYAIAFADEYVNAAQSSAFNVPMGKSVHDFVWGSNSVAANQGIALIQAYRITAEKEYLNAAIANLDYLLGRNATSFSFITGSGDKTPRHIHHRISEADGISDPVPGLLAGGPNKDQQDGCDYPSSLPAKSYVDDVCSYASNEIAINWNAPFVYLVFAIEALLSPDGKPYIETKVKEGTNRPRKSKLEQNYPNPFNSSTAITFYLQDPKSVSLRIFSVLGEEVSILLDHEWRAAGKHIIEFDALNLCSGIYICLLEDKDGNKSFSTSIKLVFMK